MPVPARKAKDERIRMKSRLLIVDDESRIVDALGRLLRLEGYDIEGCGDGLEALTILERGGFDAMLLDLDMPRLDGIETLRRLRERGDTVPVLIVSGRGTIARAVEAVKLGAHDFIEKPVDDERLLLSLKNAIEFQQLKSQVEFHRAEQVRDGMVVESDPMRRVMESLPRIALSGSTVLLTGETGTGKEVIAHRLHQLSHRGDGPFIKLNCAALPDALAESELFGHVRGAFTGATRDRKGRFQLAHGGTLFLDEVGELNAAIQAKLLRALGEGEFEPVGSERTLRADVRVVAATNRDLAVAQQQARFRSDLFYRLAILEIRLPPLRDRRSDIAPLAHRFLEEMRRKLGHPNMTLSPDACLALERYAWPGNIRELRNVIERVAVTQDGDVIGRDEVSASLPSARPEQERNERLSASLAGEEERLIREALQNAAGNVSAAARVLGLERSHLYKKMKRFGIK